MFFYNEEKIKSVFLLDHSVANFGNLSLYGNSVQDINLIWMQIYEPYHSQRYTSAQIYLKEFLSFL